MNPEIATNSGRKLRNILIAITTIVLTILLFWGLQTKTQDVSLNAVTKNSTNWEIAQQNSLPTIVEFYADWCATCQQMAPDTRSLQQQFGEKLNFVMLDVDNSRWLPELTKFHIDGIPHFMFLDQKNQVLGEAIGFVPKAVMTENLDALKDGISLPHVKIASEQKSFFSSPRPTDTTQPRSHG